MRLILERTYIVLISLFAIHAASAAEMHIAGSYEVDAQGAATYQIPLQFSP